MAFLVRLVPVLQWLQTSNQQVAILSTFKIRIQASKVMCRVDVDCSGDNRDLFTEMSLVD